MNTPRWLRYVLAALSIAAAGYAFGRYAAPDKVVTVDRTVDHVVTKEDTHAREQVRILTAQLETLKRHTKRTTHTVERPDGTKDTTTTDETTIDRSKGTTTDGATVAETATSKQADTTRAVEHSRTVERARPDWRVGALVAVDLARIPLSPAYGAIVERRILGPVSVGVFGLSSGVAGLALTLEF